MSGLAESFCVSMKDNTSIRVSELCNLRINSVNLKEGYVRIYGKGAKERIVQIGNQQVMNSLNLYRKLFAEELNTSLYFSINKFGNRLSEPSVRLVINHYEQQLKINQHLIPTCLGIRLPPCC